jgi:predicted ATP-dependent endonuclease of OLD family
MIILFEQELPIIICGANNVGKTNFLRALDLYFSLDEEKFSTKNDIPYEIEEGVRGGGYNTTIIGYFIDDKNIKYQIKTVFKKIKKTGNFVEIKGKKGKKSITADEAKKILQNFKFLFIEASNVNIPKIIDEIIDEQVLPFGLDSLRKKQTESLKKFQAFIDTSSNAVEGMTKDLEKILDEFITDIPGIDSKDWKIKILFSEYEKLRQALSGIIDFTLYDKNDRKMESKGSGIQRIVLLSLMKYISSKSKKRIIWGIDEPEAFLQPALQKKTFEILKSIAEKQQIFISTHSHHFVDIKNIKNTFLFEAKYEQKKYARRPGEIFYKTDTYTEKDISEFEKIQLIKEHLGISRNDSWVVLPYNLLVEGEEDKKYIEALADKFGFKIPNILIAGGVTKIKGYLQFLIEFCSDLNFKPKIKIILDHDNEGKKEYESLKEQISKKKYDKINLEVEYIVRCDKEQDKKLNFEMEDFIYPSILLESANKFLKKQGYIVINKKELKNRFEKAYNNKCILNFLSDKTKTNNPSKDELNFEDTNRGIKKIICEHSCSLIANFKKDDLDKKDKEYPEIKKFIETICKE